MSWKKIDAWTVEVEGQEEETLFGTCGDGREVINRNVSIQDQNKRTALLLWKLCGEELMGLVSIWQQEWILMRPVVATTAIALTRSASQEQGKRKKKLIKKRGTLFTNYESQEEWKKWKKKSWYADSRQRKFFLLLSLHWPRPNTSSKVPSGFASIPANIVRPSKKSLRRTPFSESFPCLHRRA